MVLVLWSLSIRLHRIFPTVPIPDLREAILSLTDSTPADIGPFALWNGVETLLLRRAKEEEETRRRREKEQRRRDGANGCGQWWKGFVADFRGVGFPFRTTTDSETVPPVGQGDPVLTHHDLFHSPSYDAALVEHFESLFCAPALMIRRPRIERMVRQQGGSYASLRQRLEAMVLEAGGGGGGEWERGAKGGGGIAVVAKWWRRLIRIEAQEARATPQPQPQQQGERGGSTRRHPFLEREIEAFERGARQAPDPSSRSTAVAPTASAAADKDKGNDDTSHATDHFECQCCFSSSEPSSPETRFSCDRTDDDDDDNNMAKHSFCRACVRSLAQNYAFGETPLSTVSLERFALPCMAATTSDQPCTGMIGREALCRALDEQVLGALERRMTEAVLERFAAAAAATPRRRDGTTTTSLVRCPFCPYAELVDPKPGPLVETFCPAWVREPFPPSASDILRSLLGTLILLPLLAITLACLVLVTPARRLERAYERIVAPMGVAGSTSLSLSDRLILEPRLLPAIVLAHLAELCERVRARRHGQRTVFRCRNVEARGRRARWEVVMRMDALDAQMLDWTKHTEGEEERDPYVEERRRERLVRFVWGDDGEGETADSSSSSQQQPARRSPSCGRVSCLLCQAALNPSAPSLHNCTGTSSSSAAITDSNASPQEHAEESLRLAVEKAMNAAVVRECERCGAGLTKKGGEGACNKVSPGFDSRLFRSLGLDGYCWLLTREVEMHPQVTCRCGFAYCHACLGPISSWDGYTHFCPHPRDPLHPDQCPEPGCTKCSLWIEPDLGKRRREAADRGESQLVAAGGFLSREGAVILKTDAGFSAIVFFFQRENSGRGRTPSGPRRWRNRNLCGQSAPTCTSSLVSCLSAFGYLA